MITLRYGMEMQIPLKISVTVTMTEDDKNNDFGIGLATGQAATYSPLRAFAKYLATKKKVTNDQMSKYHCQPIQLRPDCG